MTDQKIIVGSTHSTLCNHELLSKIVSLYKIKNPQSCKFLWEGINDSYKITSDEGCFLLRIYTKGWRNKSDIKFEVDVLLYLNEKGAKVAYPIETLTGGYITRIEAPEGERYAIMTTFAKGNEIKGDDSDDIALYAKGVAQIHNITDDFTSHHDRFKLDIKHLIEEPLERIRPFLKHREKDWTFLKDYASVLYQKVNKLPPESLDYGFCHGDFHGANAHKHKNEFTFFDFDCCGFGLRAYDLAVFKWYSRIRGKEQERWEHFLNAYRQIRNISDYDLELVDTFISIRHIWLMGLHIAISQADGWLNDIYFDERISFLREASKNNKSKLSEKGPSLVKST